MSTRDDEIKAKEKAEKMKELRRELEETLEEQLSSQTAEERPRFEVGKIDTSAPLDPAKAKQVIEALLFAASKPLTIAELKKFVRGLTPKQIEDRIQELKADYAAQNHGFEILDIAGGYEIATQKEFAPWIFKLELQKKVRQATQSALETLAILAYKQPITRAEIEDLRGVDVSAVLGTLMERGLIKIVGKKEIAGRPFLYATTEKFLEHFGLKSLQDLPNIEEIKTIVESSVKKEELLGKAQIVSMTPETPAETVPEANPETNPETAVPEEETSAIPEEEPEGTEPDEPEAATSQTDVEKNQETQGGSETLTQENR
ncbi:MAG: SMC-Scp complex subunit ScpB [Candidatus Omnitrophica bacterium]|nr:SMC-Scp complex subunit ScpB [Candidatus Omnitrophota bacterium]